MKKKNLKSLKLNKSFISSFKQNLVKGGGATEMSECCRNTYQQSCFVCQSDICDSLICTTVFTCPHN